MQDCNLLETCYHAQYPDKYTLTLMNGDATVLTKPDQTPNHVRNSSLELLRIVAMLMIVIHHFAYGDNFSFPVHSLTINRLWIQFVNMGGKLGVNIFVLISGYFLIASDRVKLRKLAGMWSAMLFYSLASYALFTLSGAVKFSAPGLLFSFMPLNKGSWWFLEVYFILYILHPYLNIMLRNLSKSGCEKMLLVLGFCWSVMPTFTNSYMASGALVWFIYLYSIAGYIRLWADDFGSKNYIWLSVLLIMINFMLVILFDVIGFKVRMVAEHPLHWYNMQMLPTLIIPVCIFIGFKHLAINYSKLVNTIASATIGVYIIHADRFISKYLWRELFRTIDFQDSPYLIIYSLAVTLMIYVSCVLIELIRSRVFRLLSGGRIQ